MTDKKQQIKLSTIHSILQKYFLNSSFFFKALLIKTNVTKDVLESSYMISYIRKRARKRTQNFNHMTNGINKSSQIRRLFNCTDFIYCKNLIIFSTEQLI